MSKLDDIINKAGDTIDRYSAFTSEERPEIKIDIKILITKLLTESTEDLLLSGSTQASDLLDIITKKVDNL